jgi:hypothetical protein
VLAGCTSTLDVDPAPTNSDFPNTATKIQSETSLARTRSPTGAGRLVVAYNDHSSLNGAVEFIEDQNGSGAVIAFAFGSSELGFSTSDDDGTTWTRRGKVRSPSSFPVISSDPAVAADPGDPSIVYISALATSAAAWAAVPVVPAGDPFTPRLARPDGFCIARSTDGGVSFPTIRCRQINPGTTNPDLGTRLLADLPSLTVDGLGCPWLAIEDREEPLELNRTIAVFRSAPSDAGNCRDAEVLTRLDALALANAALMDPELEDAISTKDGESRPVLRTQANGDVWLGTELLFDSTTRLGLLRRFAVDQSTPGVIPGWNFASGIPRGCDDATPWLSPAQRPSVRVGLGTASQIIRAAHRMDFDVGTAADGTPDIRVVTLQPRVGTTDEWAVFGTRLTGAGCSEPVDWNTARLGGRQIQPRIRLARPSFDLTPTDWSIAYLTTAGETTSTAPRIDIEARQITGAAFGLATDLAPENYPVCATGNGYWGDYFDFVPFVTADRTVKRVVAVTDSRFGECQRGPDTAMPQHVRVTRW